MSRRPTVAPLFRLISRLGDGVFWYALMVVLPVLYGWYGAKAAAVMVIVGGINLLLYRKVKSTFARERPYVSLPPINLAAAPLDRYSFPSGHTLHAVGFSVVVTAFFPGLWWVLYPFACLIALSRPLLGLHYPSDVLVAAVIGFGVANTILGLIPAV
jgi:undecaprenyl-diphosphatase